VATNSSKDVIVVGGGIAGLVAANRLVENGISALLLEKGQSEYLCNSRFTGGAFHICFRDIMSDANSLRETILNTVPDVVSPQMASTIAEEGRRVVRWLQQQGIRFIKGGPDEWQRWMLSPPSLVRPGLNWRGRGGDVMLRSLRSNLEARGGQMRDGSRVVELIMRDGRCVGVVIEKDGRRTDLEAQAVVLADGGFQGNLELLGRYVSPQPDRVRQRGAGTGGGDGIRMAEAVGARLTGMNRIYGHVLCREAMTKEGLWPYPIMDYVSAAGIVIDAQGRRFMDEGLGGVFMTNGIAQLPDPLSSTVIFDEAIWNGPARDFILPANPNLKIAGGSIQTAQNVSGLANMIGIPESNLISTIAAYNDAVDAGRTERLSPTRTAVTYKPWPIRVAPFHAVSLAAGVTYTMGGIEIDTGSHVIGGDGRPIPGLFAAGCTTGGLEGGTKIGYVGGLAKSGVTALRAAESIAAEFGKSISAVQH
jgi:fumarate reductase flavoprotein subunit